MNDGIMIKGTIYDLPDNIGSLADSIEFISYLIRERKQHLSISVDGKLLLSHPYTMSYNEKELINKLYEQSIEVCKTNRTSIKQVITTLNRNINYA